MHPHWPVGLARTIGAFDYIAPLPIAMGGFYEAQRAVYRGVAFNGGVGGGVG